MRLAILGDSPMALVHAAVAAQNLHHEVVHVTTAPSASQATLIVEHAQRAAVVSVQRARTGDPLEADAFVVIASRAETLALVARYADAMRDRPVLIAPGGVSLLENVDAQLRTKSSPRSTAGVMPGYLVTGHVEGDTVVVWSIKHQFPLGAIDHETAERLVDFFAEWYPHMVATPLAEVTFANTNNLVHPPALLLNAARSDNADGYYFYQDGMSAGVGRLITAVDAERLSVMHRIGIAATPVADLFRRYYRDSGSVDAPIEHVLRENSALALAKGPTALEHRYVSEDIEYGLAPLEYLAFQVGRETPVVTSVITTFSAVLGRDLRTFASKAIADSVLSSFLPNSPRPKAHPVPHTATA